MGCYINRDEILRYKPFLTRKGHIHTDDYTDGYNACADLARDVVENAKTVNAVEVVRCKYCDNRYIKNGKNYCIIHKEDVCEDFFCAFGYCSRPTIMSDNEDDWPLD